MPEQGHLWPIHKVGFEAGGRATSDTEGQKRVLELGSCSNPRLLLPACAKLGVKPLTQSGGLASSSIIMGVMLIEMRWAGKWVIVGQNFMSSQVTRTLPCWSTFCSYQIARKPWVMRPHRDSKALEVIWPQEDTHLWQPEFDSLQSHLLAGPRNLSPGSQLPSLDEMFKLSHHTLLSTGEGQDPSLGQVRQWKTRNKGNSPVMGGMWSVRELKACRGAGEFSPLLLASCSWGPAPGFCLAPLPLYVHGRVEKDPESDCLDPNAGFLCLLALWPWASFLTTLCFSFYIC